MKKEQMFVVIITALMLGAGILSMNKIMDTLKHADEAECFSKTRDIRCYRENRWEKSR